MIFGLGADAAFLRGAMARVMSDERVRLRMMAVTFQGWVSMNLVVFGKGFKSR